MHVYTLHESTLWHRVLYIGGSWLLIISCGEWSTHFSYRRTFFVFGRVAFNYAVAFCMDIERQNLYGKISRHMKYESIMRRHNKQLYYISFGLSHSVTMNDLQHTIHYPGPAIWTMHGKFSSKLEHWTLWAKNVVLYILHYTRHLIYIYVTFNASVLEMDAVFQWILCSMTQPNNRYIFAFTHDQSTIAFRHTHKHTHTRANTN